MILFNALKVEFERMPNYTCLSQMNDNNEKIKQTEELVCKVAKQETDIILYSIT